jgi:hypothetical protein
MKENESNFAFISFHLFAFASPSASASAGVVRLVWTMNSFHNPILGGGPE